MNVHVRHKGEVSTRLVKYLLWGTFAEGVTSKVNA